MNNGNKPEKINGWIETRNGLRIRQKRGCKYKEINVCFVVGVEIFCLRVRIKILKENLLSRLMGLLVFVEVDVD